jgi:hypothetical protein
MEDLGVTRLGERPIRVFQLADWVWVSPNVSPFILFVAARASAEDDDKIRRFAADAVASGCAYVCAWGEGCERVHLDFDLASIEPERSITSTWHSDELLAEAVYFALYDTWPDEEAFPDSEDAAVVLAVEEPWLEEVRSLIGDQEELVRFVLEQDELNRRRPRRSDCRPPPRERRDSPRWRKWPRSSGFRRG